ncbi:hypothetical protein SAMN07250955_107111 [Arboricoccus pini]|uniref:Uncharacterized protein n=1 Tax=Arboricoccus pini TaxID=1963835 RepID=A0A212RD95_9PROT|nr:hypothetical protein [Arboricoccus pini]SNB70094.1 hypothetical protein SAMN07250955_107111 [Arboricoccus pini]
MTTKDWLSFCSSKSDYVVSGPHLHANDVMDEAGTDSGQFGAADLMPWDAEQVVELSLRLEDLIGDANQEIVVFNDSSFSEMTLVTDVALLERWAVQNHITAAGEDVSGFIALRFANGIHVYHQRELALSVVRSSEFD